MAFCQFSDTFALFDCTPVENLLALYEEVNHPKY